MSKKLITLNNCYNEPIFKIKTQLKKVDSVEFLLFNPFNKGVAMKNLTTNLKLFLFLLLFLIIPFSGKAKDLRNGYISLDSRLSVNPKTLKSEWEAGNLNFGANISKTRNLGFVEVGFNAGGNRVEGLVSLAARYGYDFMKNINQNIRFGLYGGPLIGIRYEVLAYGADAGVFVSTFLTQSQLLAIQMRLGLKYNDTFTSPLDPSLKEAAKVSNKTAGYATLGLRWNFF